MYETKDRKLYSIQTFMQANQFGAYRLTPFGTNLNVATGQNPLLSTDSRRRTDLASFENGNFDYAINNNLSIVRDEAEQEPPFWFRLKKRTHGGTTWEPSRDYYTSKGSRFKGVPALNPWTEKRQ
jgi:hypothetical protein